MAKQIPLSGPNGEGEFAIVDDEDYAAVSAYAWHYAQGYAVTGKKSRRLHQVIFEDTPLNLIVDHVDGNRLNNQRANLRLATSAQNAQNRASNRNSTSRFKGVSWSSREELWRAVIECDKKSINLGYFASELDAARAYNDAAIQYHGEFARLNVISDDAEDSVRYRQAFIRTNKRTSKYRGVCFPALVRRWVARIKVAGKTYHLGCFDTEEEAARAYDAAAKLHHGSRAFLNFPD